MKSKKELEPVSKDYEEMLHIQSVHSTACNNLEVLQTEANRELIALMSERKEIFAQLSVAIADAEAALEIIARLHPEWFLKKKSLRTPFGEIKFHASTVLEIANADITLALVKSAAEHDAEFSLALVKVETLDREALEKLDDAVLERFRIRRVKKENFSVKPAQAIMGEAISAAEQEESQSQIDKLPA